MTLYEDAREAIRRDKGGPNGLMMQRLLDEIERLRKDAARYRWLRHGCDEKWSRATHIAANYYGSEWDAAIDAAMERSK